MSLWFVQPWCNECSCLFSSPQVGLWTHLDFNIEYNGNSVIFANVSVKDVKPVPLEEGGHDGVDGNSGGLSVTHTYSVHWFESHLPPSRRAERLRDYSFFPKTLEIHWLSIINSLVLVVLLLGFVIIILMRVLKNDFARWERIEMIPETQKKEMRESIQIWSGGTRASVAFYTGEINRLIKTRLRGIGC